MTLPTTVYNPHIARCTCSASTHDNDAARSAVRETTRRPQTSDAQTATVPTRGDVRSARAPPSAKQQHTGTLLHWGVKGPHARASFTPTRSGAPSPPKDNIASARVYPMPNALGRAASSRSPAIPSRPTCGPPLPLNPPKAPPLMAHTWLMAPPVSIWQQTASLQPACPHAACVPATPLSPHSVAPAWACASSLDS